MQKAMRQIRVLHFKNESFDPVIYESFHKWQIIEKAIDLNYGGEIRNIIGYII